MFGGHPALTAEHLGEWIVLAERWPEVAQRVSASPDLMAKLEDGHDSAALAELLRSNAVDVSTVSDDLIALLDREPRLSDVIARLVHFEPVASPTQATRRFSGSIAARRRGGSIVSPAGRRDRPRARRAGRRARRTLPRRCASRVSIASITISAPLVAETPVRTAGTATAESWRRRTRASAASSTPMAVSAASDCRASSS